MPPGASDMLTAIVVMLLVQLVVVVVGFAAALVLMRTEGAAARADGRETRAVLQDILAAIRANAAATAESAEQTRIYRERGAAIDRAVQEALDRRAREELAARPPSAAELDRRERTRRDAESRGIGLVRPPPAPPSARRGAALESDPRILDRGYPGDEPA